MKKIILTILALVCALCCVFGFTGCDMLSGIFGGSGNKTPSGENMWLNESELNMEVGDTAEINIIDADFTKDDIKKNIPDEFAAELEQTGISVKEAMLMIVHFEWSSDNNGIANVEPVENNKCTVFANSDGTTYIRAYTYDRKYQASCKVTVTDPSKEPDKPDKPDKPDVPDTPDNPVEKDLVFEFYDVTCEEDYPYLNSIKSGMLGQTMTFKTDGTVIVEAGSYKTTAAYVKNGNIYTVTASGSSADYTLENGILSYNFAMSNYHFTGYFKLKGEDKYDELAGKTFRFVDVSSDLIDESTLNTFRLGYKYATVSYSADGTFELYNPSESIDTEPNAYSLQIGTFTCTDGDGYMTVTNMWSGGEIVDIITATYALTLDGNTLSLSAGGTIFTYTLVTD